MRMMLLLLLMGFIPSAVFAKDESVWSKSYALEANGKYEMAAALLVPMLDQDGENEFATMRYAWLNYLQGNYNDAIKAYSQAMARNPLSIEARLGIALPLMAQRRWNEAARYLRQVLAKSPYDYIANLRLMACEAGLRKWEKLEKHALSLSEIYPSNASVLVYLARSYAWQGKTNMAKAAYAKVLVRSPSNLEALRYINK